MTIVSDRFSLQGIRYKYRCYMELLEQGRKQNWNPLTKFKAHNRQRQWRDIKAKYLTKPEDEEGDDDE